MDKRKQDLMMAECLLLFVYFQLCSLLRVDRKLTLNFIRISLQKLLRQRNCIS